MYIYIYVCSRKELKMSTDTTAYKKEATSFSLMLLPGAALISLLVLSHLS